jgi:hypothetical protein
MITAEVEADGDDVLAGWLFPELALVLEDEDPHAATAATAPRARPLYSMRGTDVRPERWMAIFMVSPLSVSNWLRCFHPTTGNSSCRIGGHGGGGAMNQTSIVVVAITGNRSRVWDK